MTRFMDRNDFSVRPHMSLSQKLPTDLEVRLAVFYKHLKELRTNKEIDALILNMDEVPVVFETVPVSQFILPPGQLAPRGASQPRLACPLGGKLSRDILPPTLVIFTPGGQAVQAGLSCPPPIQRKFCCVMFTIICNTLIITWSS